MTKNNGLPAAIGRFEIRSELGSGGMGQVFRARDPDLDRDVALKVIRVQSLGSPKARARFQREARTAAGIKSPSVVSIYELGEHDGNLFIVMELVEGQNLHEYLETGPLAPAEARPILRQVAEGLSAAHEKDVVHRDLKAQNVMLTTTGEIKILDFGLAKKVVQSASVLTTKEILGTVNYMSPEQLRGQDVDQRSDLFSFGVFAYWMLTGQWPFPGESNIEISTNILNNPPMPARQVDPRIPADLSNLIDQLLEKDPSRRPRSSAEVVARLEGEEISTPAPAAPVDVANRTTRPMRRMKKAVPRWRRKWVWAKVAVVFLAVALAAVFSLFDRRTTVAVLGFDNLTGNAELDWLETALVESLAFYLAFSDELDLADTGRVAEIRKDLALEAVATISAEQVSKLLEPHLEADLVILGSYGDPADDGPLRQLDLRLLDPRARNLVRTHEGSFDEEDYLAGMLAGATALREGLSAEIPTAFSPTALSDFFPRGREARRLYFEGRRHLWQLSFHEAGASLEAAMELEAGSPVLHQALAAVFQELDAKDAAVAELDLASSSAVAHWPWRRQQELEAWRHELAGAWDEAIRIYQELFAEYRGVDGGLRLAEAQVGADRSAAALETLGITRGLRLARRDEVALDLAEARTYARRGEHEQARHLALRSAQGAANLGARFYRAQALLLLGEIHKDLGETDEALEAFDQARQAAAAARHPPAVAEAFELAAALHAERRDLGQARRQLLLFLASHEKADPRSKSSEDAIWTVVNLCGVLIQESRPHICAELLRQTVTARGMPMDEYLRGSVASTFGAAAQLGGDLAVARAHFQEAQDLFRVIDDQAYLALAATNEGEIVFLGGDLDGAEELHGQALAINRETDVAGIGIAYDLYRLGKIAAARAELEEANELYAEARDLWQQLEDTRSLAHLDLAEAELEAARDDLGDADDLASRASDTFWQQGMTDAAVLAEAFVAETWRRRGRPENAREIADRLAHHAEESDNPFVGTAVDILRARLAGDEAALAELGAVESDMMAAGHVVLVLEARLAMAEIGGRRPTALIEEARQRGFEELAQRAERLAPKP